MQIKAVGYLNSPPCVVSWSPVTGLSTHHCCHQPSILHSDWDWLWLAGKQCWCCWWDGWSNTLLTHHIRPLWPGPGHISSAIHLINSQQEFAQFTFYNIKLIFHCSSHVQVHTYIHGQVRGRLSSNFVRKLIFPLNMSGVKIFLNFSRPCWEHSDLGSWRWSVGNIE